MSVFSLEVKPDLGIDIDTCVQEGILLAGRLQLAIKFEFNGQWIECNRRNGAVAWKGTQRVTEWRLELHGTYCVVGKRDFGSKLWETIQEYDQRKERECAASVAEQEGLE